MNIIRKLEQYIIKKNRQQKPEKNEFQNKQIKKNPKPATFEAYMGGGLCD